MKTPVIIVSGASRGLGAAAARIVGSMGAVVVLSARSVDALEGVAESIRSDGGTALSVPGDVSQLADCQHIVDQTLVKFERVDGLINNAGVLSPLTAFADASPADWERNLAVNFLGAVNLSRLCLPYLRATNGRMVYVSSGAAINPQPGWSAYCASKAALNHFNRVLALEEPQVTSICMRPGVVDTEMQALIRREGQAGMPEKDYHKFVRYHVDGKLLPPGVPGRALALLALYAPREWSGEFISWDDERITALSED